jgi:hypothetical protein
MKWHIIKMENDFDDVYNLQKIEFNSLDELKEYVEEQMNLCDIWFACCGDIFELYGPSSLECLEEIHE